MFIGWPLYWKLARMLVGRVLGHLVVWLVSSPNNTLSAAIDSNMESENQFKCDNANKKQQIWAMWELQSYFQTQTQTQTRAQKDRHGEGIANQWAGHAQSMQTSKQTNTQTFNRAKPARSSAMQMKELRALSPALGSRKAASLTVRICRRQRANAKAQMQRDILLRRAN